MASYEQWRQGKIKRVTWVCGPELVLVREVTDSFCRQALDGFYLLGGDRSQPAASRSTFTAGGDIHEHDIWDVICEVPAPGERTLVIVREAQRLEHMTNVSWLADRTMRDAFVLFISSDTDYAGKGPNGGRVKFPGPAAVDALSCGQIVKCTISDEDKVAWLERRLPGTSASTARAVLVRCGWNLSAVADVAVKAEAAQWPAAEAALLFLAEAQSPATFEDDLIYHRKREALLHELDPDGFGKTAGLLNSRLGTLAALYAGRELTAQELSKRVPQNLINQYRQAVPHYTPRKVHECRKLLAILDTAWRNGAREGLYESLTAMW